MEAHSQVGQRVSPSEVSLLIIASRLAALASVAGGFYAASEPHRSAAWIVGGVVAGVGWWAVALIVSLLDRVVVLLER